VFISPILVRGCLEASLIKLISCKVSSTSDLLSWNALFMSSVLSISSLTYDAKEEGSWLAEGRFSERYGLAGRSKRKKVTAWGLYGRHKNCKL